MATSRPHPAARGDEAELFRSYNDELLRTVAANVHHTSPQVIEDACAFAWAQFLQEQPDRDRNWQGWLFRTAQRQAWALNRDESDHVGLRDFEWEDGALTAEPGAARDTAETHRE